MPIRTLHGQLVPDALGPVQARCSVRWQDAKHLLAECPDPKHDKYHGLWRRDDQGFRRVSLQRG